MSPLPRLQPYQTTIARAVLDSVLHHRGLTFTVEIAHQGGGHELSAQLELLLLALHTTSGAQMVKVASRTGPSGWERLGARLSQASLHGLWTQGPHAIRIGKAEQLFVCPEEADLLHSPFTFLEVTEAQELPPEVYHRSLMPLAEQAGATVVLYGTPWNGATWFEQTKQHNRQLAQLDGHQRHFRVPWQEVARFSPLYGQYVEQQRTKLGSEHPSFQTRYDLRPLPTAVPLLPEPGHRGPWGTHPRRRSPRPGFAYVASVQVSRAPCQQKLGTTRGSSAAMGITVLVTIGELASRPGGQSTLHVVDHRWWQGQSWTEINSWLVELLRDTWGCQRVVVEPAPGHPQLASLLQGPLTPSVVEPYSPDADEESALVMSFLAAVNTGRLGLYAPDGSPEYRALRHELEVAKAVARPLGLLTVELPAPTAGFLRGLLLLQRAAQQRVDHQRLQPLAPALAS